MEQGPAIVGEARQSNVHILWGTDKLMDRLAAFAAGEDCSPQHWSHRPLTAFPVGYAAAGGITVNRGCVNFKLAEMLRIKVALTLASEPLSRSHAAYLSGVAASSAAVESQRMAWVDE